MTDKIPIRLNVNGYEYSLQVRPHWNLTDVLRNQIGFKSVKKACGTGECGSCTVILNGKAICSCIFPAVKANGSKIITVEGLSDGRRLHPIQEAFITYGAVQCGFCTPGLIMKAKALLDENPSPTEDEVKEALKGNICRCTGLVKPVKAIMAAAEEMRNRR